MTEKYWSRFSATYDRNQESVVGMELLDEIKRELSDLPDLGVTVELGSGTGYFTESIARRSTNLLATDLRGDPALELVMLVRPAPEHQVKGLGGGIGRIQMHRVRVAGDLCKPGHIRIGERFSPASLRAN